MSQSIIDSRNNILSETSFISTSQSLACNTKGNILLKMNEANINTNPENTDKENSQEHFRSTQSFTNVPDSSMSPNRRHRLFNSEVRNDSNNYQEEDLENAKNCITFGEDVMPNSSNEIEICSTKDPNYSTFDNNVFGSNVLNDIWKNNLPQASTNTIESSIQVPVVSNMHSAFNLFQNDPKNVESFMIIQRLLNQSSKNPTNFPPKKHNSLPTANLLYESPPIVTRSAKSFDYNSAQDINEKSLMELIMQHNASHKGLGNTESTWPSNSQYAQNLNNDDNLIKHWNTLNGDLAMKGNLVSSTHDNQYAYSSHHTNASSNIPLNNLYNYTPQLNSGHMNYNATSTPFHINFPKQPHHHSQNAQHGVNINQAQNFQQRNASNMYPKSTLTHYPFNNKHPTHFQHQGLNSMRPITGAHPGKRGSHNIFGSYSHQSITNMSKTPPTTLNSDVINNMASKSGSYNLDRASLLLALNAGKNAQVNITSNLPSKVSLFNLKQKYEEALREQQQQQQQLGMHQNQYLFNEKLTEPLHFDFQQHNISDLSSTVSPFEKDGQPISPLLLAATKERFERQRFPSSGSATTPTHNLQQLPQHPTPKGSVTNNSNYFDINANHYEGDPTNSPAVPNKSCEDPKQSFQDGAGTFNMSSLEEQILSLIGSGATTYNGPAGHKQAPFGMGNVPRPTGSNLISSPIDSLISAVTATSKGAIEGGGGGLFDDHHHIKGFVAMAGSDSGLDLDTSFSPPFVLSPLNAKPFGVGGVGTGPAPHLFGPQGFGPEADGEKYSRKVFVGGLPPDIDEEEITNSFRGFGYLVVDWPHKAESKSYFPPKGYAFLLFQEEASVQSLMDACYMENGKHYLYVSSPTIKDKPVQIRAWNLGDADFVLDASQPLDPRKTIFVGGVPRPLRAVELALIMDRLYGNVCYAGIDTDPELKYPKGAGRVAFSTKQSYIAAISARFVQLQHADIDKRVEVKPYVLDDQNCDECNGMRCMGKYAPFFCANVACLKYYCELCWATVHTRPGKEFHKPLVKEGGDRPRTLPFRLY